MLVDDSAEEDESEENEEPQEYIFYDIETRQDDA